MDTDSDSDMDTGTGTGTGMGTDRGMNRDAAPRAGAGEGEGTGAPPPPGRLPHATQPGQPPRGGSGSGGPPGSGGEQRLHRVRQGRMLGGVAAGLADYLDIDPTLVRLGFAALTCMGGLAVPLYLAGWVLIPDEDTDISVAEELFGREQERRAYS